MNREEKTQRNRATFKNKQPGSKCTDIKNISAMRCPWWEEVFIFILMFYFLFFIYFYFTCPYFIYREWGAKEETNTNWTMEREGFDYGYDWIGMS